MSERTIAVHVDGVPLGEVCVRSTPEDDAALEKLLVFTASRLDAVRIALRGDGIMATRLHDDVYAIWTQPPSGT